MLNIGAILVGADFSGCSEDAFRLGRALARDYGARLIVLHVATAPPFVNRSQFERALEQPNGYRAELEHRLREVYPAEGIKDVVYQVRDGDPAREILDAAQDLRCGLIVLGTHGRTGLDRLLTGSITEQVLRKGTCPVLSVKVPSRGTLANASTIRGQANTIPQTSASN